ncbi:hypothetical protein [Vibrio apostichopi]|uniref:hypothetical protein n=1 Tax=Vibrio apostichopi TaxID=3035453 RepID=UPI002573FA7C|nr:hypothetical protein [Vibrio sp. FE10]
MNEEKSNVMTEEEIVAAPETDYMDEAQLASFENRVFELDESTCADILKSHSTRIL